VLPALLLTCEKKETISTGIVLELYRYFEDYAKINEDAKKKYQYAKIILYRKA